jgi:exosortase
VIPFSIFLLWHRRELMKTETWRPSWWGLVPLLLGAGLQAAGAMLFVPWFESSALLLWLVGLALVPGGPAALRWAWPAIGFLAFMVPLPYRLENALGGPLQRLATVSSTYILQTLGLPAFAEGNVIQLDKHRIGVVEACNGLGMLVMFVGFAVGAALVLRRGNVDKVLILLGAVPIAILANVLRITTTGVLSETFTAAVGDTFYHDLAGWIMMPLALLMLWAEVELLDRLFVEAETPTAESGLVAGLASVARGPDLRPRDSKLSTARESSVPRRG